MEPQNGCRWVLTMAVSLSTDGGAAPGFPAVATLRYTPAHPHEKDATMLIAAKVLVALVLLIHVYIFLLETVLFDSRGRKVFGLTAEKAEIVRPAMSNQGCYNGFLALALALRAACMKLSKRFSATENHCNCSSRNFFQAS